VLKRYVSLTGGDPETRGLLGSLYKKRYFADGSIENLDAAIEQYRRGFEGNRQDLYMGRNLVQLQHRKGGDAAGDELAKLLPELRGLAGQRLAAPGQARSFRSSSRTTTSNRAVRAPIQVPSNEQNRPARCHPMLAPPSPQSSGASVSRHHPVLFLWSRPPGGSTCASRSLTSRAATEAMSSLSQAADLDGDVFLAAVVEHVILGRCARIPCREECRAENPQRRQ
jgi:hypothetical protein